MIELQTGIPGSAKTLSFVDKLNKLLTRWENHPEEARPVFVHNIPSLLLKHSKVPLKSVFLAKAGEPVLVPDWDEMPVGSLVLIDEADTVFPPRSSQSVAPAHVNWLTEHRKHGFDVWITTQHPKFIDSKVRALAGKHQHFRRLFGRKCSAVYEWDGCNDSLSNLGSAVITLYNYPKDAFKFYKSAEVHNKQSFRLPKWILIPVAGALMGLYFVPVAYSTLSSGMAGKGLPSHSVDSESKSLQAGTLAAVVATSVPPVGVVKSGFIDKPEVPDTPFTRPVVLAAACVASESKCRCYTAEGVRVNIPEFVCRRAANENVNFADLQL